MARKAIKHGIDRKSQKLAIVDNGDDTYDVLVKCANYAGHVRGGIVHTWRYAIANVSFDTAETLFKKRNVGA